jgi:glyoxylase-like metal-dependent hydrolase (beta-lactamase superfamily II)
MVRSVVAQHESRYGSAIVSRVVDIDPFALGLGFLFPGATLEALAPAREALADTHIDWAKGTVLLAVQSHLIRFGGKTILIDACVGEHKQRPARPEWHQRTGTNYMARLAAAGCTPDDVDIVMCTHLHADHVGWNTRLEYGRWMPTFSKARYLISQTEIDQRAQEAAAKPEANHGSFQDSVLPVIEHGLVTTVKAGDEFVDGVRILPLPGHAPGQIGLELAAGKDEHLVFCGDAIHSAAQVFQPDWFSAFCHDRKQAVETRRALLARAAAGRLRLIPNHLRGRSMRIHDKNGSFVPAIEA